MDDMKLTINISIPEDVFVNWTTEQIEQYIQDLASISMGKAIKERTNRFSEIFIKGEGTYAPVGIYPRAFKNAF